MTTKNENVPPIKTSEGGDGRESPPPLAPASTTSNVSDTESLFTPHKPIKTPQEREEKARLFVESVGLNWIGLDPTQRTRAMKIQSGDFTWSPTRGPAPPNSRYVATFSEEWEKFVAGLPEPHKTKLSDTFSNVFFDEEAVHNYMGMRQQLSGICGSHACVLHQHYVESFRAPPLQEKNHKMLDISSFILNNLSTEKQKLYIEKGTIGMNAHFLLKQFTQTKDHHFRQVVPSALEDDTEDTEEKHYSDAKCILNWFKTCGPALVSALKVGREFMNGNASGNHVLEGAIDLELYEEFVAGLEGDKDDNWHAMVMIGAYKCQDEADADKDKYWFVLQNTHKDAYFKLVDSVHLASCGAKVFFAGPGTDMSLKPAAVVTEGEYIESSVDLDECCGCELEGQN